MKLPSMYESSCQKMPINICKSSGDLFATRQSLDFAVYSAIHAKVLVREQNFQHANEKLSRADAKRYDNIDTYSMQIFIGIDVVEIVLQATVNDVQLLIL